MRSLASIACTLLVLILSACGGGGDGRAGGTAPLSLSAAAQVGEKLFNDPVLSGTGTQS